MYNESCKYFNVAESGNSAVPVCINKKKRKDKSWLSHPQCEGCSEMVEVTASPPRKTRLNAALRRMGRGV